MSVSEQNIHQRLHAAQAKVDYIQRERKSGMRYSIVSHDAVTAKVRPILHECGVVYYPVGIHHTQHGNRTEVAMCVRFANVDHPEDHIDVPSLGYGIDDSDKGPGKAISYAVKYALLKTLGLETGDDPDLDQSVTHKAEAAPQPAQVRGNGQYFDDIGKADAWKDWAKGGKDSECAKWGAKALLEIAAIVNEEDLDKWTSIADHKTKMKALYDHNPARFDKLSTAIDQKRDELRAKMMAA